MKPDLMQQQIDLFPPALPAPHLSHVERMWQIAFSAEVRAEVLAIFAARSGEWLDWKDFRSVIDKYKISSWFGHVLSRLVREEVILEQIRYFGSDRPGDGNYMGFHRRWASLGTEGPLVVVGTAMVGEPIKQGQKKMRLT